MSDTLAPTKPSTQKKMRVAARKVGQELTYTVLPTSGKQCPMANSPFYKTNLNCFALRLPLSQTNGCRSILWLTQRLLVSLMLLMKCFRCSFGWLVTIPPHIYIYKFRVTQIHEGMLHILVPLQKFIPIHIYRGTLYRGASLYTRVHLFIHIYLDTHIKGYPSIHQSIPLYIQG